MDHEQKNPLKKQHQSNPWVIWLISVSFVLFQFFLQLSSGVVIGSIMHDMHLSALIGGLLSCSLYIVYTGMQIPVGILLDRNNTRMLLSISALVCSLGCFLFASSHQLFSLFLGRILIGCGASFAFVGLTHVLRKHFPAKKFAFMIGLSETIGLVGTMMGIIGLGATLNQFGWHNFIQCTGLIGLTISLLCWRHIPNSQGKNSLSPQKSRSLLPLLSNPKMWLNGLYIGLSFTVVTVFGALWATPFIQAKLGCSQQYACWINAIFFLGAALSCPLFGMLSVRLSKRKPLILSSSLSTTGTFLLILYWPMHSVIAMVVLLFILGLCCGAYIIAYPIANELCGNGALSTSTGFTNTLALVTTPILQPLVGYSLDHWGHAAHFTLDDFQHSLVIIPCLLVTASILVYFLPEKKQSESLSIYLAPVPPVRYDFSDPI